MIDLLLIGPPGAGKGTQAAFMAKRYGLLHLAAGDLLRQAVCSESKIGKEVQSYLRQGELVPDSLIAKLIGQRIKEGDAKAGVIFDGFPRNLEQAEMLDQLLQQQNRQLKVVLSLQLAEQVIIQRLSSRRICRKCQAIFNTNLDPDILTKGHGQCQASDLIQRDDDKPETIKHRLEVYRQKTLPLIKLFNQRGILREIDSDGQTTPEQTFVRISKVLDGVVK